jgi:hypothetical protein
MVKSKSLIHEVPLLGLFLLNKVHREAFGHNKSSQVKFYDMGKECGGSRASGIVRMEIEPSYDELRKFSKTRRVVDLLTKRFFLNRMEYYLPQIMEKLESRFAMTEESGGIRLWRSA